MPLQFILPDHTLIARRVYDPTISEILVREEDFRNRLAGIAQVLAQRLVQGNTAIRSKQVVPLTALELSDKFSLDGMVYQMSYGTIEVFFGGAAR